jgi:hypothetical protein
MLFTSKLNIIMSIDLRFRIAPVGRYNPGIDICYSCDARLSDYQVPHLGKNVINHIIGFFEHNGLWYTTVECPICFTKFYFHLRKGHEDSWYELFIESVNRGTNLHFKPINKDN